MNYREIPDDPNRVRDTVDQNALILERLRRKSPRRPPSASEVQIARKMLELIQRGEIGLVFNDPDDCDRDWSDTAVIDLVKVMLTADRKFLINEILEESVALHYPMQKLMEHHPDYRANVEKWEGDQGPDPMTVRKDRIELEMQDKAYLLEKRA